MGTAFDLLFSLNEFALLDFSSVQPKYSVFAILVLSNGSLIQHELRFIKFDVPFQRPLLDLSFVLTFTRKNLS